ncbi:MAG: hypothetical protein EAZ43_02205 [Betaproteobacteria bacterium]|nr:MAG: hypothetical protein EAZ43_02205 [Betaproteobacteria bacterium]
MRISRQSHNSPSASCRPRTVPTRRSLLAGVTLIELMVAIALGLIVIASVGYIYLQGRQGFKAQDDFSKLEDDGRFIIEVMSRDIRNARFLGCQRIEDDRPNDTVGDSVNLRITASHPFFTEVGSAVESSAWLTKGGGNPANRASAYANISYLLRGFENGAGWPASTTLTGRLEPNTDVLMLMKIGAEGRKLSKPPERGETALTLEGTNPIPGHTTDGRVAVMVLSSCGGTGAEIIKPDVQNGGLRFELDNTLNTSLATGSTAPGIYSSPSPDVMIAPFEPVAYYVSSAANNPSTNLPSLMQVGIRTFNAVPSLNGTWDPIGRVVASGVENMQLRYLVNGAYLTAAEVGALGGANEFWPQVRAVEVTLTLVSSNSSARTAAENQSVQGGQTKTDRYLRKELRFVVEVPN